MINHRARCKGRIERWAAVVVPPFERNAPMRILGQFEVSPGAWREIITSTVVDCVKMADGTFVETRSGSIYELGEVDPDYRKEMEANGVEFDAANPIKVVDERSAWTAREDLN